MDVLGSRRMLLRRSHIHQVSMPVGIAGKRTVAVYALIVAGYPLSESLRQLNALSCCSSTRFRKKTEQYSTLGFFLMPARRIGDFKLRGCSIR